MIGKDVVMVCQHGVDGMSKLVRHGRHIICTPLIVEQHPRRHIRGHRPTKGTTPFPFADFAIQMIVVEDALGKGSKFGRECPEGFQHHFCGIPEIIFLVRLNNRCVDVISAQFVDTEVFGFQFEIALEDICVFLADIQQGIDSFIGDVVAEIAGGDGIVKVAQVDILVAPIADPGLIHLPEDRSVFSVYPIKFLISSRTKIGICPANVGHQLTPCEFLDFAIHFEFVNITVGDGAIQIDECAVPGNVLDVDNLLFGFAEGMRFKVADLFEVITVVTSHIHETLGGFIIHVFPPQIEKECSVLNVGIELLNTCLRRLSRLILRIC